VADAYFSGIIAMTTRAIWDVSVTSTVCTRAGPMMTAMIWRDRRRARLTCAS